MPWQCVCGTDSGNIFICIFFVYSLIFLDVSKHTCIDAFIYIYRYAFVYFLCIYLFTYVLMLIIYVFIYLIYLFIYLVFTYLGYTILRMCFLHICFSVGHVLSFHEACAAPPTPIRAHWRTLRLRSCPDTGCGWQCSAWSRRGEGREEGQGRKNKSKGKRRTGKKGEEEQDLREREENKRIRE